MEAAHCAQNEEERGGERGRQKSQQNLCAFSFLAFPHSRNLSLFLSFLCVHSFGALCSRFRSHTLHLARTHCRSHCALRCASEQRSTLTVKIQWQRSRRRCRCLASAAATLAATRLQLTSTKIVVVADANIQTSKQTQMYGQEYSAHTA